MITVNELQQLADKWSERKEGHSQPYKDALSECTYELTQLINHSIQEEIDYNYLLEMEADSYLSSMEAHEPLAWYV